MIYSGDGDRSFEDGSYIVYSYVDNDTFGNQSLATFSENYRNVHGYLSLILCIFGIIANINNIAVLTHKRMISPSNYILTSIGVVDIQTLLSYGLFASYAFISKRGDKYEIDVHKGWIDYAIATKHVYKLFMISGTWLTIALAVFQYVQVCHVKLGQKLCTEKKAKIVIVCTLVWSFLTALPLFLLYEPVWTPHMGVWVMQYTSVIEQNPGLKDFTFVFYGIVIKLMACMLLVALSVLLIRAIYIATKKNLHLRRQSSDRKRDIHSKTRRRNRTTIMLVCVLMLFVLSTFPSGIVALITGIDNDFYATIFVPFIELFDLFVLINCAVKFVLYCCMSQEFRKIFIRTMDSNIRDILIRLGFKNITKRHFTRQSSISTGQTTHTTAETGEGYTLTRMDDDEDYRSLPRKEN